MFPRLRRPASVESEHLIQYARVLVRAGYLDDVAVLREVAEAAGDSHAGSDVDLVARELVDQAVNDLADEQQSWPVTTDFDRLQAALAGLRARGLAVLEYVEDHWSAAAELARRTERGEQTPGVVWFTPSDVWHAVENAMLELNLWHGNTANVVPGDALLDEVVGVLERHGLAAHFDEGRVEVAALWRRRRSAAP